MGLVDRLLASDEASIRLQTRRGVEQANEAEVTALREQVRPSARAATLLSERNADGTISGWPHQKWSGAHWVLVTLAELGYPPGDRRGGIPASGHAGLVRALRAMIHASKSRRVPTLLIDKVLLVTRNVQV